MQDYKVYNQLRSPDGRFQSFMEYGAVAMEKDSKWKLLKDIDIVSFKVLFAISRGPCKCIRVTLLNWKRCHMYQFESAYMYYF